jgi:FKBP-type peptidyl-prolyl cis-trans isomerase
VEYALYNERGALIDSSRLAWKSPIVGEVGDPIAGPPFLPEAIELLRLGSKMRIEVPWAKAFDTDAVHALLPEGRPTIWELALVKLRPARSPRPLPAFAHPSWLATKKTPSGLRYEIIEGGSGDPPALQDMVTVHFAGWLSNGTLFDDSLQKGIPLRLRLADAILGWQEGLRLMRPGAIYRFAVPPALGFALRGQRDAGIGPNRVLYYYVELLEVERSDK